MEMASISSSPRTVEEIFKDYSGRRAGIVRALTYGTLPPLSLSLESQFVKILPFEFQMSRTFTDSVIQVIFQVFVGISDLLSCSV